MEINFDNFMINNKNDMFVGLIQPQPQTSMFGSVPSLLQGLVSRIEVLEMDLLIGSGIWIGGVEIQDTR